MPDILDCTLRDGSYPIDFQFTAADTHRIANGLEKAGVGRIEVGHGLGLRAQKQESRTAAESDRTYIESAVAATEAASVGVFFIPGIGRKSDLEMARDAGADFVRIGQNATSWDEARPYVEAAANLGFEVHANLMKSYAIDAETLGSRLADLEEWGAEIVYIVDSAGGMLPEDVTDYVASAVTAVDEATVGFHGHDNLGLAVGNVLSAVDAGAGLVDTTLRGVGRSAGNPGTEAVATVFERRGWGERYDQKRLMDLGEREIAALSGSNDRGPAEITAGFARFHSKFLAQVNQAAEKHDVDPRDLMVAVSEEEVVDPSTDLVDRVARTLAQERSSTTLESRTTGYLQESELVPGYESDLPESPSELGTAVRVAARKRDIEAVVSITAALGDLDDPLPTVVHRGPEAVFGNIQVDGLAQMRTVVEAVDGVVDTIVLDTALATDIEAVTNSDVLRFDANLGIARAVTQLVSQRGLPRDEVVVLGRHIASKQTASLLRRHGFEVAIRETVERETLASAVSDAGAMIAFSENHGTVGEDVVAAVPSDALLLDAGIRSFTKSAVRRATEEGRDILRSDVRAGYVTEVECATITRELLQRDVGERVVNEVRVVAGGIIGAHGDVVVDSLHSPSRVFGVADGQGGLVEDPSKDQRRRMRAVENAFDEMEQ